jgi:hypothetical protein
MQLVLTHRNYPINNELNLHSNPPSKAKERTGFGIDYGHETIRNCQNF